MARWPLAVVLACLVLTALPVAAQDADLDGIENVIEAALAEAHAPILYFHPSETYFPTSVEYALNNSVLERYQSGGAPLLENANPTAAVLATYNIPADPDVDPDNVYYLNNTGGTIHDEAGIQTTYEAGAYPDTVYVHVRMDGAQTIIQYWFYYAFNPGTWNNHEGDWEMVSVILSGTASGNAPLEVGYSQHESGERMPWEEVDRDGTHPKVYVARGSHSSYLRSYEGNIGISGDDVSDAGPVWRSTDYALVNVGEVNNPTAGNEWIQFAGRWGEFSLPYEGRAEAGPPGPAYRQGGNMFTQPIQWANGLDVPNTYMLLGNWFIGNLFTIFLLFVLLGVVLVILRIARVQRKTHAGVKMWPFAHMRTMNRTTVAILVAVVGILVGLAGFLLPWYSMTVDANAPGFLVTDGPEEILGMDGVNGLTLNPMRSDGQLVHVSVLPIPLGLMLAITTALFFVRIMGTKTSRRLGARFVVKGVVTVLPLVFVILVMSLVIPALPADDPSQLGVDDFLRPIASSPFGGGTTQTVNNGTATVTLSWGLGIGVWLMVVSAVLLFVAGGLAISHDYAFLPRWYAEGYKSEEEWAAAKTAAGEAPPVPPPGEEGAPFAPATQPPDQVAQPPEVPEMMSRPTCANCGASFEPGATVCGVCGSPLS
jgi:hypothetical protein